MRSGVPQAVWELFRVKPEGDDQDHPYLKGLRDALDAANGVYQFFDPGDAPLYSSKAERQTLWREMNLP